MSDEEQVCEHFTNDELADLRDLLDQLENVALDDDVIASKIGYKGKEVVITRPSNVKELIREGLDVDLE